MTIQQMKNAILNVYETTSWRKKVENMYDDQIVAIYHNFSERGILDKVLRKERPKSDYERKYKENNQQLTIFDFIKEEV